MSARLGPHNDVNGERNEKSNKLPPTRSARGGSLFSAISNQCNEIKDLERGVANWKSQSRHPVD